jgi:hypothetical protein
MNTVILSKTEPAVNTVKDPTNYTVQLADGSRQHVSSSRARELVAAGAFYVHGLLGETVTQ